MNLLAIEFEPGDDGAVDPSRITVKMTRNEALLIAQVLGHMKGTEQEAMFPGGNSVGTDIYDCLVSDMFNRYWDDGVRDALQEARRAS